MGVVCPTRICIFLLGTNHMKKVLILKPRLDVLFKKSIVPIERGPIGPIKMHWKNFVDMLAKEHEKRGDKVEVLELPNWQFSPELIDTIQPTRVYIPHKQNYQFPVSECYDPHYYMQMVFPWLFQIDPTGWGPDATVYPIQPCNTSSTPYGNLYSELRQKQLDGESKFEQPEMQDSWEHQDYLFFPCQIPHDEAIIFHSQVSVADALKSTIEVAEKLDKKLIIKAHPVNPGSMTELRAIGKDHIWADSVNINNLIANADAVVMVNSGVGMEAILHGKRVACFGDADYDSVVCKVSPSTAVDKISSLLRSVPDEAAYRRFINSYFDLMYDTTDFSSFGKIF